MQHIIVDLEFAPVNDKSLRKKLKQEVIEIGAVRLDENYNYVDSFDLFVKPDYTFISTSIYKLTGISEKDIHNAPSFDKGLEMFLDWIGDGKFRIYEWSENDKAQIIRECRVKGIDEKYDILCSKYWRDIQRLYMRVFNAWRVPSLKMALDELSISFEGKEHRACDDAGNTAEILRTMAVKDKYNEAVRCVKNVISNPGHSSTLGELLGMDFSALYEMCEAC